MHLGPYERPGGVQRYLEKDGRALATDFLNLDAPVKGVRDGLEDYAAFEWWRGDM